MSEQDKEQEAAENQNVKDDWVAALLELMKQIREWTVELTQDWENEPGRGMPPCVIDSTVERHEEYLGRYFAPALAITSEDYTIEINPVGRFDFMGAVGRVNMTNYRGAVNFLYSKRKGWFVMENRKPLTREMFFELLELMSDKNNN